MSNQRQGQLDSLTGLRFFAAMMVFVNHVLFAFPDLSTEGLVRDVFEPLGTAGVCFFYVLSGFILTYVYSSRSEPLSIREFYLKRIARIWPLHLTTMLIVLFGVVTLRYQLDRPQGAAQIVANAFLLQTWWPEYRWVFCINGPSWSLSNEAFFYFVFPWLVTGGAVAFGRKFVAFIVAGIVALAGLSLVPTSVLSESSIKCLIQTNPLVRLFDFMTGMACGFLYLIRCQRFADSTDPSTNSSSKRFRTPGFAVPAIHIGALLGAVIFFLAINRSVGERGFLYTHGLNVRNTWLSVSATAPAFAITIFAYAWRTSWVSRFFGSRLMVYLGEISFAFYLIHQAILTVLSRQTLADSPNAIGWLVVSALFLSLAAAMLLYHLVELPSRAGMIRVFSRAGSSSDESMSNRLGPCGLWLVEYGSALSRLCFSPKILVLAGLLVAGYLFADAGLFDFRGVGQIERVIDRSADEFKNIQFDQDAVLKGLDIEHRPDGSCQIQMVWHLKKGRRPTRFLHICDSDGKILRHGSGNPAVFAYATGNEIVLDRVTVTKEELESAAMLAIGFYGPERKSARIINPLPGQPTHRLPILRLEP